MRIAQGDYVLLSNLNLSLWILFFLSLFVSKSGLDGALALLFILWVYVLSFHKNQRTVSKDHRESWFILLMILLGALTNLFSMGGARGTWFYLIDVRFMLIYLILGGLVNSKKSVSLFLSVSVAGLVLGLGKSLYLIHSKYHYQLNKIERLDSFWDISRWGILLMFSLIFISIYLFEKWNSTSKEKKWSFIFLIILSSFVFILNKSRAPWLGLAFALVSYSFIYNKKALYKMLLPIGVCLVLMLFLIPGSLHKVQTIVSVKTDQSGMMTSSDGSNAGRLHMWQVGMKFFKEQPWVGTGYDLMAEPYKRWLDQQPDNISQLFYSGPWSLTDMHNTYLHILITMGIVFTVPFFLFVFWLLYQVYLRSKDSESWIVRASFLSAVSFMIICIFYVEFFSFMGYFFWIMIWLGINYDHLQNNGSRFFSTALNVPKGTHQTK